MITKFDKASLDRVRREVDKSLSELGEKLGITLQIGNISYQDSTFTAKLNGSLAGFDTRAKDWSDYFWKFDLEEDWLGRTFTTQGREYKIVGLRPRARKTPVLIECVSPELCVDGKTYQTTSATVRLAMLDGVLRS